MSTMRAFELTEHGGPEALVLRTDRPRPEAGPGQVVIAVRAAAVNNTDIWTRKGAYGLPGDPTALAGWRGAVQFPRIQGGDIAGEIVEVGPGVAAEREGARVVVDSALYASEEADAAPVGVLGSERDGGFAEFVVVEDVRAHDVGESPLTDEQLACLPVAYGTAMGMIERGRVATGETVVVTGASGGVGIALVQLAAACGARVVAITSAGKIDQVRAAGADVALDRASSDLVNEVRRAADTYHAVLDVVGGEQLMSLIPLLADDGRWIIAGAMAGAVVQFDLRRVYLNNISLIGSSMHTRAHFDVLMAIARAGDIAPVIAERYPLNDLPAAQARFETASHVGKIVITS